MGRASRCLRNSFFTKSTTTQINNKDNHTTNCYRPKWITTLLKSCKDINRARTANSVVTSSKSIATSDKNEQSKIVVDDDKSVAAASNTAVEVVRVTKSGRVVFDPSRRAAVVVQSVFRGYLVLIVNDVVEGEESSSGVEGIGVQALVKGYIVRKRAVDQVRRMQALIRAQARARAIRAPVPSSSYSSSRTSHSCILDPLTPEYTEYYESQVWSPGHDHPVKNQLLRRNNSKSNRNTLPDQFKLRSSSASSSRFDEEKIDKIVEVDSSSKPYKHLFELSDSISHNAYRTPGIPYLAEDLYLQYSNQIDRYSFYTADHIIPQSHTGSFRSSSARRVGHTVSTNVNYPESHLSYYPNYMAYTKSSKAKMRSLSAPRQRTQLDRSTSYKGYSSQDYGSMRLSASGLS